MKAKIIILMILIVLFTIFVSQNTEVVTVKAYFWQFKMSIIVLISLIVNGSGRKAMPARSKKDSLSLLIISPVVNINCLAIY